MTARISAEVVAENGLMNLSIADLLVEQREIESHAALIDSSKKSLQAELVRRFSEGHAAALKELGKTAGTRTEVLPGGVRLKADTRAKVKWDQQMLWTLAADFTREQLEHYCKIELTPKEAVYKALEPGSNIKGQLAAARTDEPGSTTFKLLGEGEK